MIPLENSIPPGLSKIISQPSDPLQPEPNSRTQDGPLGLAISPLTSIPSSNIDTFLQLAKSFFEQQSSSSTIESSQNFKSFSPAIENSQFIVPTYNWIDDTYQRKHFKSQSPPATDPTTSFLLPSEGLNRDSYLTNFDLLFGTNKSHDPFYGDPIPGNYSFENRSVELSIPAAKTSSKENTFKVSRDRPPVGATKFPKVPIRAFCTDCVPVYSSSCHQHNCQTCNQRVGSFNALLCQECDNAHHIACLTPPLINLYHRPWKCHACQPVNDAVEEEPVNYTGKVPGILVGSSWKFRLQLNKVNLHKPSMAGIHGSRQMPAYSIVLQGAYKTDEDHGNHFYYTGSGGYQNNKHIKDQVLEGANLSLAASCDAFLDTNGAEARDWRKSAPIRVIRGSKLKRRSSLFAPENLRYDGIYKLVRYWKELVPEGFFIWRFHFQRDDVEPAPWTSKGVQYILDNNLKADAEGPFLPIQKKIKMEAGFIPQLIQPQHSGSKKEGSTVILSVAALDDSQASASNPIPHFGRSQTFSALDHLIRLDTQNQRLWDVIRSLPTQSTHQFLTQVRQTFACKVCFDLVEATAPCTTPCGHNFCWSCLHASARQNRGRCPHCKKRISKFFSDGNAAGTGSGSSNPLLNSALSDILLALRPALDCET